MWLVASFVLQAHLLPLVDSAGVQIRFRAVVGMWLAFGLLSTVLSTLYGMRGREPDLDRCVATSWVDRLLITAAFTFIGR